MSDDTEAQREYTKGDAVGTVVGHFPGGTKEAYRLSPVLDTFEWHCSRLGWQPTNSYNQARYRAIKAAVAKYWPEKAINEHIYIDEHKGMWVRGYDANEVIWLAGDNGESCQRHHWRDVRITAPRMDGDILAAFKALWGRG